MKWGMLAMQSKISLVNTELGKTIARSVGWVTIVHFLGLFFAIPLEILMTTSEEQREYVRAENLFQFSFETQVVISIAIPVLLAIFLFRFLQVKPYSDFMHSLPVKRAHIFHQYTLTGFILLVIPVLLTGLIVLALYIPLELVDFFTIADIFVWVGITIMLNSFVYMAGVFIGMITGISAVQGVLTYLTLVLPVGLIILLAYNLPFYLYGFPEEYFMESKIESFSPLVALSLLDHSSLGVSEMIAYSFLTIILYGVSLRLYKMRKLEAVSQALVFPLLKPFFKYGATFCTMLLGGMYFGKTQGGTIWILAGYLTGAILGYVIAEMVLQKSWRIIIHLKGLFMYAGVIGVLVVLFQFDFSQYEKKMPAINDIKRVHLSGSYYSLKDSENPYYLSEQDNIELVWRLHKEIIANKHNKIEKSNDERAFFVYELKNGKKLVRNYSIDKKEYAHFYKLIHESDEYKRMTNEIFRVNEAQVDKISIHPFGPINKKAVIIDPTDLKEAIAILKEEAQTATYEDIIDERDPYSNIEILQRNDKTISLTWPVSYRKFEEWLEMKGLLDQARVHAEDISYALIANKEELQINHADGYSNEDLFKQMSKYGHVLKVTDKAKLETSIVNASGYIDGQYLVGFYYKGDGTIEIKSFSDNHIPEFVKQYFQ